MNIKCELIENEGLPGLNIEIFNMPELDRVDAAKLSSICTAALEKLLKIKKSRKGNHTRPPSYRQFLKRIKRKHSEPNRECFESLGQIKIGDIRVKGDLLLHGWTVAALTNELRCRTALDIVMLTAESMLSGIGIGTKGFAELVDWFKTNYQFDPWPGANPQRLYAAAVAIRVQKMGKPAESVFATPGKTVLNLRTVSRDEPS